METIIFTVIARWRAFYSEIGINITTQTAQILKENSDITRLVLVVEKLQMPDGKTKYITMRDIIVRTKNIKGLTYHKDIYKNTSILVDTFTSSSLYYRFLPQHWGTSSDKPISVKEALLLQAFTFWNNGERCMDIHCHANASSSLIPVVGWEKRRFGKPKLNVSFL